MEIVYKDQNKYLKKVKADALLLSVGGVGYAAIELVWRGYTHWSMGLAGGICFVGFGHAWDKIKELKPIYIPICGSLIITLVELIFGIIFNIILKKAIWDYSTLPFQFMGQISLLFSTLWGLLSIPVFPLAGKIKNRFM